jgi:hypothetical protein
MAVHEFPCRLAANRVKVFPSNSNPAYLQDKDIALKAASNFGDSQESGATPRNPRNPDAPRLRQ